MPHLGSAYSRRFFCAEVRNFVSILSTCVNNCCLVKQHEPCHVCKCGWKEIFLQTIKHTCRFSFICKTVKSWRIQVSVNPSSPLDKKKCCKKYKKTNNLPWNLATFHYEFFCRYSTIVLIKSFLSSFLSDKMRIFLNI